MSSAQACRSILSRSLAPLAFLALLPLGCGPSGGHHPPPRYASYPQWMPPPPPMAPPRAQVPTVTPVLPALSPTSDEGMWLLNQFPSERVAQKYGFKPDQAWLDHVRLSSVRLAELKGKIVELAAFAEQIVADSRIAVEKSQWKVSGANGAAELLGVKTTTLLSRMKAMGIKRPE